MCCGIHEPSGVEPNDRPKEDTPKHKGPSADCKKRHTNCCQRKPVPFADPHMKFVFAKFRHVRQQLVHRVVHSLAGDDPAHVSPQTAIARRMWIALFVGVLMMGPPSSARVPHTVRKYSTTLGVLYPR